MIVVDTSAWVELLRKTGSAVHLTLRELIVADAPIAVTEVVIFEVLAGASTGRDWNRCEIESWRSQSYI